MSMTGLVKEESGAAEESYKYDVYNRLVGVSGLYYLRARYMSPETGSFISR